MVAAIQINSLENKIVPQAYFLPPIDQHALSVPVDMHSAFTHNS